MGVNFFIYFTFGRADRVLIGAGASLLGQFVSEFIEEVSNVGLNPT